MKTYDLKQVKLKEGFFKDLQDKNRKTTIFSVYKRFKETGRFQALKHLNDLKDVHVFWDSDAAKWLESAAYILSQADDKKLRRLYDEAIDDIVKNQDDSGYFNSHFQVKEKENIFKKRTEHELYCAGHLFEAAIAASYYLGDNRLLGFAEKYCECIKKAFIVNKTAAFITPGHEEIELALYKLYSLTALPLYKELFDFFLENRGKKWEDHYEWAFASYDQSHDVISRQTTAEGHAVRAVYLYSAMSDYAYLHDDKDVGDRCSDIFDDIVKRKMYVNGAIGSSYCGEAFTVPYDLPSDKAYAETCAAIGLSLFCQREIAHKGCIDPRHGEVIEKNLYNSIICSLSLDGKGFFYVNPLEVNYARNKHFKGGKWIEGQPILNRVEVFDCSCCPPNVTRIIELLPTFIFYSEESTIYIDQLISSSLKTDEDEIEIISSLPFEGEVEIKVTSTDKETLRIRKPAWCSKLSVSVPFKEETGYLIFPIKSGDSIKLAFDMTVRKIHGNPLVSATNGKTCFSYGPFILAAEQTDNKDINLFATSLDCSSFETHRKDGYFFLSVKGIEKSCDTLYTFNEKDIKAKSVNVTLIPYYQWANREDGDMVIWFTR